MGNRIKGKKLLILAGAEAHSKVVQAAQELGVYTIVTDYLPVKDAPAKKDGGRGMDAGYQGCGCYRRQM